MEATRRELRQGRGHTRIRCRPRRGRALAAGRTQDALRMIVGLADLVRQTNGAEPLGRSGLLQPTLRVEDPGTKRPAPVLGQVALDRYLGRSGSS